MQKYLHRRIIGNIFVYMSYTLKQIWDSFRALDNAVDIDLSNYESSICGGVKIIKSETGIELLCTNTDMYRPIESRIKDVFLEEGVEAGILAYKLNKYEKIINTFPEGDKLRVAYEKKHEDCSRKQREISQLKSNQRLWT